MYASGRRISFRQTDREKERDSKLPALCLCHRLHGMHFKVQWQPCQGVTLKLLENDNLFLALFPFYAAFPVCIYIYMYLYIIYIYVHISSFP